MISILVRGSGFMVYAYTCNYGITCAQIITQDLLGIQNIHGLLNEATK